MARSLPSIPDGVNMQRLLDVLAQAGIVPCKLFSFRVRLSHTVLFQLMNRLLT